MLKEVRTFSGLLLVMSMFRCTDAMVPPGAPGTSLDDPAAPLLLTITTPSQSSAHTPGMLVISGTASSGAGIDRVEVGLVASGFDVAQGQETWQHQVDTSALANGTYEILVRAFDKNGHLAQDKRTVHIDSSNPVAGLFGYPSSPTRQTHINITVGGSGVVGYSYALNDGQFSEERSAAQAIQHSELQPGDYLLRVIAKNAAGSWQSADSPTTLAWSVHLGPHLIGVQPAEGALSEPQQWIALSFDQHISNVHLGGSMGALGYHEISANGRDLRVRPTGRWWNSPHHTLEVVVHSSTGAATHVLLHYAFSDGLLYISPTKGSDSDGDGSQYAPFASIAHGLLVASGQSAARPLALVAGEHSVGLDSPVNLLPGSGLLGGFCPETFERDRAAHISTVVDGRTEGGSAASPNAAVSCHGPGRRTIDGVHIVGGSGQHAGALLAANQCDLAVHRSAIRAGNGPTNFSLSLAGGFAEVSYSSIEGGEGHTSRGVSVAQGGYLLAYNNQITGGLASSQASALHCFEGTVLAFNNTVHMGSGPAVRGLMQHAGCLVELANNIVWGDGADNSVAIEQQNGADAPSLTVLSNNFYGHSELIAGATTVAEFEASIASQGTLASGNVAVNPVFRHASGADGLAHTLGDNDWRLAASQSPCQVKQGGLNGSAHGWPFADDFFAQHARQALLVCAVGMPQEAAGWSMGAFELEPFDE